MLNRSALCSIFSKVKRSRRGRVMMFAGGEDAVVGPRFYRGRHDQ